MADQFASVIAEFERELPGLISIVFKKIGMELYVRIVIRTPADTGRARGNWVIAIGKLPSEVLEQIDKSGRKAIGKALAALASFDVLREMSIFIANNLDYIHALEEGHSKIQAPQGMVQITISEFLAIAKKSLA